MSKLPIEVVKLGGSLLGRPGLAELLTTWLAKRETSETRQVLLVGGGPPVDWLRDIATQHQLSEETAHWAAIEMMNANAPVVAELIGVAIESNGINSLVDRLKQERVVIYVAGDELWRQRQNEKAALPVGWHVTSDSIAAWLATQLTATLTLLKSTVPATIKADAAVGSSSILELSQSGYVDSYFPTAAASIETIRFATLERLS